jgi:hypothetical protein
MSAGGGIRQPLGSRNWLNREFVDASWMAEHMVDLFQQHLDRLGATLACGHGVGQLMVPWEGEPYCMQCGSRFERKEVEKET